MGDKHNLPEFFFTGWSTYFVTLTAHAFSLLATAQELSYNRTLVVALEGEDFALLSCQPQSGAGRAWSHWYKDALIVKINRKFKN